MALETCPKCEKKLHPPLKSTGRQVCSSCGWSDKTISSEQLNNSNEEKTNDIVLARLDPILKYLQDKLDKIDKSEQINYTKRGFSNWIFNNCNKIFIIGIIIMLLGLFMDTTVCGEEGLYKGCTHNLGKLNERSNVVNLGGFIAVCGSIFMISSNKKHNKD
ncbi:MAG: hypothetical protein ACRC11_03970 [Xenococcaceae cyanobacterium]